MCSPVEDVRRRPKLVEDDRRRLPLGADPALRGRSSRAMPGASGAPLPPPGASGPSPAPAAPRPLVEELAALVERARLELDDNAVKTLLAVALQLLLRGLPPEERI